MPGHAEILHADRFRSRIQQKCAGNHPEGEGPAAALIEPDGSLAQPHRPEPVQRTDHPEHGINAVDETVFARRFDPIVNVEIGGNVNEPSGNFNLGMVGPLKTTVRITTRTLNSVTGGSKQLTVKWAGSSNFTGYQVQIATDADFTKNVKTVKIANAKTYQTNVTGLKAKTTYYVRVRSYHEFNGMTYYGGWSNVKSAKTK